MTYKSPQFLGENQEFSIFCPKNRAFFPITRVTYISHFPGTDCNKIKTGCSSKRINFVQTGEISVWGIGARRGVREKGYEWLYSMENSL